MKFLRAVASGLAVGCALAGTTTMVSAEDVTLRYSNWLPAGFGVTEHVIKPWIADVERVTEGRVKVEILPKPVGTVLGQYDVVADGLADMSLIVPSYTAGRFPIFEGLEQAFIGDDMSKRSPASWKAFETFIQPTGETSEVHVVGVFASNAAHVATTGKEVQTITDLQGLKLRTPGPAMTAGLENLGAVPVSKPMSEVYELAAGGVIDGGVFPVDVLKSFRLEGVIKQMTLIPGGLGATHMLVAMNKAAWNRISDADRKAILEVSGAAMAERAGAAMHKVDQEERAFATGANIALRDASPELAGAIKEKILPVRQAWIAKAKEAGLSDPAQMLTFLEEQSK